MTDPTPTFATQEEADAWIATYNRGRCICGGSPAWIDPRYQVHRVDCEARNAT